MGAYRLLLATTFLGNAVFATDPKLHGSNSTAEMRRLRNTCAHAANECYAWWSSQLKAGSADVDPVYRWSRRWMNIELSAADTPARRATVVDTHLSQMKKAQDIVRRCVAFQTCNLTLYLAAANYRAEADALRVAEMKASVGQDLSARLAVTNLATARLIYDEWRQHPYIEGFLRNPGHALYWSKRIFNAQMAARQYAPWPFSPADGYLERSREVEVLLNSAPGSKEAKIPTAYMVAFYVADAQVLATSERPRDQAPNSIGSPAMKARVDAAKSAYESFWTKRADIERTYEWSNLWRSSATAQSKSQQEILQIAKAHLARMRALREVVSDQRKAEAVPLWYEQAVTFYESEAEIIVLEAQARLEQK
jgi:hypothetical protein